MRLIECSYQGSLTQSIWATPRGTGYQEYPPSSQDKNVVYNNQDSSIYALIDNIKFYNSAALVYNGKCYVFALFEANDGNITKYDSTNGTSYRYWTRQEYTILSGAGYILSPQNYNPTTLDGVTVYYDPYIGYIDCDTYSGDLPVFTNPTDFNNYIMNPYVPVYTSNGGGATHIAKVTGQLSTLSSNLPDVLIVSGGGGGGMLIDDDVYVGADAGGISGSGDNSADQTTGNAFGLGESGTSVSGGGSGFYGGYKGVIS